MPCGIDEESLASLPHTLTHGVPIQINLSSFPTGQIFVYNSAKRQRVRPGCRFLVGDPVPTGRVRLCP